MANFFLAKCPTCRSQLRVRSEYLGKKIMCNHCGHHGLASVSRTGEFPAYVGPPPFPDPNGQVSAGDPVSSSLFVAGPRPSGPVGLTTTIANGSAQGRVRELAEVVQRTREELSAWGTEHTKAIRDLGESQLQIIELRGQVQALQEQLDRAREQHQQDESARRDLEGEQTRLNGLLSEFEPVRGRAAEADLLESMLQERDCEAEQLRGRAAEADILESMLQERDREAERLRSTLGELDRSLAARTSELDEARRQREELGSRIEETRHAGRAEVESLQAEIQKARAASSRAARVAEEKAGELSAVLGRLRELRADLDARNSECEQLRRDAGEFEETRVDHELLLGEIEGYRSELRARDAELECLRDQVAELDALRTDRERIDVERQEGVGESETLRARLVELEQLLAERDETCRQSERDREELAELWSLDRQELLDQAERQLGEERIRAKVELQGWQNHLNTASQQFARDLVSLRTEVAELNQELEMLRQEQDHEAVRAGVGALELHRSAAHPDEPAMLPGMREPVSPVESDRFAKAIEERRPAKVEAWSQRISFDEVAPLDLDHEEPHGRTLPAGLSILGSLIVVAIGLLPFWFFEISWESYVVASLLILVGVMVLGFVEGRYTGKNPILRALQMALVVGVIIAAVLLIGPRVLERTFPQPARSPSGK